VQCGEHATALLGGMAVRALQRLEQCKYMNGCDGQFSLKKCACAGGHRKGRTAGMKMMDTLMPSDQRYCAADYHSCMP
jgi:hypothetical protein